MVSYPPIQRGDPVSSSYSGSPLPANTGTIPRPEKPPLKNAIGPVNLIWDISIIIEAGHQGWITTFSRAGNSIISCEGKVEPWLDRNAPARLSDLLHSAIPELNKGLLRERLKDYFSTLQDSPDGQALVSEAVTRIMKETISVSIERSDPPSYIITLAGGHTLSFKAKEIADQRPSSLNVNWLSAHPKEPLNANKRDFQKVIEYWISIAEEVDPAGAVSPWEAITERLQNTISRDPAHDEPAGLIRNGLYLEGEILWISNTLIQEELRQHGKDSDAASFSRYLKHAGYLIHPSKVFRIGNIGRRAWGFRSDFRSSEAPISSFASLEDEKGDRI
jgi:hypothetical protein